MALPVAHVSIAMGATRSRDPIILAGLALLSVLPDFDFALVWGFGLPIEEQHRTWSHSVSFAVGLTLLWHWFRPRRFADLSARTFFAVLISHALLDLLCTEDPLDHGVMLFWPLSDARLGWSVLVPLYLEFAESPFTLPGALRFTLVEFALALPLWGLSRGLLLIASRFRAGEPGAADAAPTRRG